ncbi:MAG: hypothetical protein ACKPKO_61985 [Candidatus Fonsibacter sp.]
MLQNVEVVHFILKVVIYIYIPTTGTKLIKILLSGSDWLDPSTFRIMFDLKMTMGGNHNRYLFGGPWGFFSRMRILGGASVGGLGWV